MNRASRVIFRSFVVVALVAVSFLKISLAGDLRVEVLDQVSNPVAGAQVYVIFFSTTIQEGSGGGPDPSYSQFGTASSTGVIHFTLVDGLDYFVFATSHNYTPTLRDQVMDPFVASVNGAGGNFTKTLTSGAADMAFANVVFVNVPGPFPKLLMGDVRGRDSFEPVAFAMIRATDTVSSGVVPNVPRPAAGEDVRELDIGFFSPADNLGSGDRIILSSEAAGVSNILDFNQASVPSYIHDEVQQQGPIAFGDTALEGVLKDNTGRPVSFDRGARVEARQDNFAGPFVAHAFVEPNGKYSFFASSPSMGIYDGFVVGTTYYIEAAAWGFRTSTFTFLYDGVKLTSNPIISPGTGVIKGHVRAVNAAGQSILLPRAHVNAWPDWNPWPGADAFGGGVPHGATGGGFTQSATGYYEITGLTEGNYQVQVWTEFAQQPAVFNFGPDQNPGCGGVPDDRRVSVGSDDIVRIYACNGAQLGPAGANVDLVVKIATSTAGIIKGTLSFPGITDLRNTPVMITAREPFGGGGNETWEPPKSGFAVVAASGAAQYDYQIDVPTGTLYELSVSAEGWGLVYDFGHFFPRVDLQLSTSSIGNNFTLARAGKIKGVIKLPDGMMFKPCFGPACAKFGGAAVDAQSLNVQSFGWDDLGEDGVFEISGLLPGLYNLKTHGWGEFPYVDGFLSGVAVGTGTTKVEIRLEDGVPICAQVSTASLPSLEPTEKIRMALLDAGTPLDNKGIAQLLDWGEHQAKFELGVSTTTGRCKKPIRLPNKAFDVYLLLEHVLDEEVMTSSGPTRVMSTPTREFASILGTAKNYQVGRSTQATIFVRPPWTPDEVTCDPQTGPQSPGCEPADPITIARSNSGTRKVSGSVIGANIIRLPDCQDAQKDFNKLFKFLPFVSAFDSRGVFVGASIAIPNFANLNQLYALMGKILSGQCTSALADVLSLGWVYSIENLPAGAFTIAAETPNYPPLMFSVDTTAADVTRNINFDTEVGAGATIEGVVENTAGVKIKNASVEAEGENYEKTVPTDADGNFKFEGLPPGFYTLNINADGYAAARRSFDLEADKTVTVNLTGANGLVAAPGVMTGTVFDQRMPSPKVRSGAVVLAYNDTLNNQIASGQAASTMELALIETKTGTDGKYKLSGLTPGDVYKIFVLAPGKYLASSTATAVDGELAGVDFTLVSKPPRPHIGTYRDSATGNLKGTIKSPKKLSKKPVVFVSSGTSFNEAADYELSVSSIPGDNLYAFEVPSTTVNLGFVLRVIVDDGAKKETFDRRSGVNDNAAAEEDLEQFLAQEGNVKFDSSGSDASKLKFGVGALTRITGATSMSVSLSRQGLQSFTTQDLCGSGAGLLGDLYQIEISSAQINAGRSLELSVAYDKSKVTTTEAAAQLQLYQFDFLNKCWKSVPGSVTVNTQAGTIMAKLGSISRAFSAPAKAAYLVNDPEAGLARYVQGQGYQPMAGNSNNQAGTFAVGPAVSAGVSSAGRFLQYSVPNPFDLKAKTVTLRPGSSPATLSTNGTYLVFSPTGSGNVNYTIRIYNVAADLIREITGTAAANQYNYVEWDGKNKSGSEVASGVYFATIDTPGAPKKRPIKMVVVK
ncbi:MAG: carboxypeptidase regulatory-like domain-containing protein [Elusimicrobia bacterium]|nr:carboxypeptidase regulatory-like domain-containing protein [Elusimicrobiota bacterium]